MPTTSPSSTSAPPTSDLSGTQTPASVQASPLGTATSAVSEPTSTGPWPATFTPEQVTWSQEAWAAWGAYDALTRQAYAAPSEDWAAELAEVAVGPELDSAASTVNGMAQASLVQTGFMSYELVDVTSAAIDRVDLRLCSDMSEFAAHYADGSELPVDKSVPRTLVSVMVVRDQYAELPWLVAEFADQGTVC